MHSKLIRHLLISFVLLFQGSTVFAAYTPGQTPPAPTALQQELNSTSYAGGFRWTPVTLPWVTNGSQTAFGGAIDTTSRLSVNPQGAAENGLTVNMPSAATGYGIVLKDSTNTVRGAISANPRGITINAPTSIPEFDCPGITVRADGGFNTSTGGAGLGLYPGFIGVASNLQKLTFQGSLSFGQSTQLYETKYNQQTNASYQFLDQDWNFYGSNLYTHESVSGGIEVLAISSPAISSVVPVGVSGTTTYAYRVSAVSGAGETIASTEVSTTTGNITLSGSNYNSITWTQVTGAESYNVYGRSAGIETKLANVPVGTWNDTGSATPSGALPTTNTTGYMTAPIVNATTAFQANGAAGLTTTLADGSAIIGGIVTGAPTKAIPTSLPPNGAASGDLTGTYPAPTLTTSGVTGAAYTFGHSATYDAKGRATSATNPSGVGSATTFLRGDGTWATPAGGGTVTSVGLSSPSSIFTVTGSPVTGAGTLTQTLNAQTANTILAGPASGAAAIPTLRALVPLDIPAALAGTGLTSTAGVLSVSPTAVTAGSYTSTNLTVGADGRITAASNGSGGGGSAPAGTDTQTLRYNGTVLSATSNILTNTIGQTAVGGSIDTLSRLAVNAQGDNNHANGEKGISITMPNGDYKNAFEVNRQGVNNPEAYITNEGSFYISLLNSSTSSPAIFGFAQGNAGQAGRVTMGDANEGVQGGNGQRMQLFSIHGIEVYGATGTNPPAFTSGGGTSDACMRVIASTSTNVPVAIQSASGQTADLTQWQTSTNSVSAKIDKNFVMTAKGYASSVRVVTVADTATLADSVLLCNGTFTETLPATGWPTGYRLTVKDTGTGTVTLTAGGTVTFDGATTITFATQYKSRVLIFDGVNFQIESGLL